MAAPVDTQDGGAERVHMLTTGTSTVFETNGRWVLVGGDHAAYQYLKNRGVKVLDAYVAPNANPDVIEGAPAIIRDFKPKNVWATSYANNIAATPASGASSAYARLTSAMQEANRAYGARTTISHDDTRFTVGDMTFHLYHALPGARYKSGAASSTGCVGYMVKASAHGGSVLLSGDVHATDGISASHDSLLARVGDVVEFPEYLSTSTSLAVADDFSDSDGGELTVMEIRTPRGLHMSAVSTHADEDECLLPRNMRLRMVGVRREETPNGGVRVVKTFEDAQ